MAGDIAKRCSFAASGIAPEIYIYDADEVVGFEFEDDNRLERLYRATYIFAGGNSPYRIEHDGADFSSEWDPDSLTYTHTLTVRVADYHRELARILTSSHNSRYFAAFRIDSERDWTCVGYRHGCSLTDSSEVGEDGASTTITFKVESKYPTIWVDGRNFSGDGTYSQVWTPSAFSCEVGEDGKRTGNNVAGLFLATDRSGEPLDRNGQRTSHTGLLQAAMALEGTSHPGYDVVGTYKAGEDVHGTPSVTYDLLRCSVDGHISASPSTIYLNSTNRSAVVTVNSDHSWTCSSDNNNVSVYEAFGGKGGESVEVFGNRGQGGRTTLTFTNNVTRETAEVECVSNYIEADVTEVEADGPFLSIPVWSSTSSGVRVTITGDGARASYDGNKVDAEGFSDGSVIRVEAVDDPTEYAEVRVSAPTGENAPRWEVWMEDCVARGVYLVAMRDENPISPTYQKMVTKTINDDPRCPYYLPPAWTKIGERCEGDDKITTYRDENPMSRSYMALKEEISEGGCAEARYEYYAKIAGFYPQRKEIRIRYERGEEWDEIGEGLYVGWFSNGEAVMNPIASDGTWTSVDCRAVNEAGVYTKISSTVEMTQTEADSYARGEAQKAKLYLATSAMYTEPDFYMVNDITVNPEMETFQYPGGKIKTYLDKTIELPSDPWSPPTSVIVAARTDRWASSTYFNVGFRGEPFDGNAVNFGTNDKAGGFGFARVPVRRNDPNLVTQWVQDFMADKAYVRMFRNGITQVGISEAGKAVFGYSATDKSTDPQDNDIFINGQGQGLTLNSNGYLRCEVTEPITSLREAFKAFTSGKNCSVTEICIPLNLDCDALTDIAYAFSATDGADENLKVIYDLAHIDISHCTSLLRLFENRKKLETLVINYWSTSHITSWYGTFHNCEGLKTLKIGTVGALDHSTLTNDMFKGCANLTDLHVQEIRQGLSLSDCAKLNLASIRRVLYALNEPYGGRQTLTVSQATWDIIQADQTCLGYIEAASGLGWTVAR